MATLLHPLVACVISSLLLACDSAPEASSQAPERSSAPAPAPTPPEAAKPAPSAPRAPPAAPAPPPEAPPVEQPPEAAPPGGLTIEAAAEMTRAWASANPHGGKLPTALFRADAPISLAIEIDACDGPAKECTSRVNLDDAAAFEGWLKDTVGEVPGMDVSSKVSSCNDANCCTFANLGREASKDGVSLPHELMELRSVCFEVEEGSQAVLGVRRMKFVNW